MRKTADEVKSMTRWQRAVYMRYTALEKASKDLSSVPQGFLKACMSAQAFSLYENRELEIEPLGSRNTLFKHADILFRGSTASASDEGRRYLESMRKTILQKFKVAGQHTRRSTSSEVARLRHELQLAKELLDATQKCMLAQSTAYVKLLQELGAIARDSQIEELGTRRLVNLLNRHDEMFSGLFDPMVFDNARPDNVRGMKP